MIHWILKYVFRKLGWRAEGVEIAKSVNKAVFAVGPHTSNWDFFLGLAIREIYRIPARFLAKQSLFVFPLGTLMHWLGGYPVDRSSPHGMVDQVADIFKEEPSFLLAITPEGTRSKVQRIKTGFYHIAHKAQVPVIPVTFDYEQRLIRFYPQILPGTPKEAVIEEITRLFRQVRGRHPELGV